MKDIILGILFVAILLVAVGVGWSARNYMGAKDSYDAFKAGYLCGEAEAGVYGTWQPPTLLYNEDEVLQQQWTPQRNSIGWDTDDTSDIEEVILHNLMIAQKMLIEELEKELADCRSVGDDE